MRAGKLIALSAVAVLVAGADLAIAAQSSMHCIGANCPSQGSLSSQRSQRMGIGPSQRSSGAFARANPRELGEAGAQERERTHGFMRNIPRVANVGADIRIDAIVPKSVRQAAAPLPAEVQRMHPRFRNDRAFLYRDQVVIVNPRTARIEAIVKAPPGA